MSSPHKISLSAAILMNLNIMAGAGIFINITNLTAQLSLAGGLLYLIVGLFMFPLVFTIAQLVKIYPSGGFYAFTKPLSPLLGFMSTWTYFFGKMASVALYLNVITNFLKLLFPTTFAHIPSLWMCMVILALYIYLNCLNLRIGVIIQKCFIFAKTMPIFMLIALGIYHFNINLFAVYQPLSFLSFITMLPSVLYCFTGFEATCSVSRNIENAEINGPKAIFYSFFSIILIYVIFQTLISMMLLPHINQFETYAQAYPFLMTLVPVSAWLQTKLATALSFLIGFSAMGAAYGILFSNSWNLYTLAQHKHTIAAQSITTLNQHGIPTLSVFAQGLICCAFLWITNGNQIPLQQISALASTIPYTISSVGFLMLAQSSKLIGTLSLLTCSGFIVSCIISAIKYNFTSLYLFGVMFILGLIMYVWSSKK